MELPTLREGLRMPFSRFWPIYLDAHRQPATRSWHYAATVLGATMTMVAVARHNPFVMAAGIGAAVCIAIMSHRVIEKNRPLVGVNPFYGAVADVRMCWLALRGELLIEYARLGLVPPSALATKAVDEI